VGVGSVVVTEPREPNQKPTIPLKTAEKTSPEMTPVMQAK